ncbi:PepSY domain-containing protein [Wenzhouxiangella sp. EGI_FJ10409]|uniref:PepSY domain-containing protein n=1 Tax=Wenzhouxiangella sp. EGI_FJ10409 TaxID=3243767 RepID=UPI0035DAF627
MCRLLKQLLIALTLAATLVVSAWAITLEEAARRVAQQYDAKVVSAQTVERDGRRIHVIRIVTEDGVVRTVRVPAGDD